MYKTKYLNRSDDYYKGYADGFNDTWDSVEEWILGRRKGKPLSWGKLKQEMVRDAKREKTE